MKKSMGRYFFIIVSITVLVIGIVLIPNFINSRRIYKMPIEELLSNFKLDPLAFEAKFEKHIVYVTGRVYYVFKNGDDTYASKPGIKRGSHLQLIDPSITPNTDIKDIYANSICCVFYNRNLSMFENLDFLDPMKRTIITIKGTLYVENGEIILLDSINVGSEKELTRE